MQHILYAEKKCKDSIYICPTGSELKLEVDVGVNYPHGYRIHYCVVCHGNNWPVYESAGMHTDWICTRLAIRSTLHTDSQCLEEREEKFDSRFGAESKCIQHHLFFSVFYSSMFSIASLLFVSMSSRMRERERQDYLGARSHDAELCMPAYISHYPLNQPWQLCL